jgi:hypothetical protein
MKRSNEIPDDLMATSSKLSPRLPNVMIDDIRMAIGIASVSNEALAYQRNCSDGNNIKALTNQVINILPQYLHHQYKKCNEKSNDKRPDERF